MSDSSSGLVPTRVVVAAVIVGFEALAALVFGVIELTDIDSQHPSVAVTTSVFFVLYAAGLGWCAWGLVRLKSWSRAPIMLGQFLQLGLAWSFFGDSSQWVSMLLGIPALVVLVIVVSPSTTTALYGDGGREGASR